MDIERLQDIARGYVRQEISRCDKRIGDCFRPLVAVLKTFINLTKYTTKYVVVKGNYI